MNKKINYQKIEKKYLPKRLRAVKIGNSKDQTDFTRVDNHPTGKIYYTVKHYDLLTTFSIEIERLFKSIVDLKNSGYQIILLEQ